MIDLFELRIGNKINKSFDHVCNIGRTVGCVLGMRDKYEIKNFEYQDVEPIVVTEEVLMKCGFKKVEKYVANKKTNSTYYDYYWLDNWFMKIGVGVGMVLFKDRQHSSEQSLILNEDIYLHRLQNLYQAITGKELNVER